MARTAKWEHPTDGWHIGHRIERKARPAGRLVAVVAAEMDADEPTPDEIREAAELDAWAIEWQERYYNDNYDLDYSMEAMR